MIEGGKRVADIRKCRGSSIVGFLLEIERYEPVEIPRFWWRQLANESTLLIQVAATRVRGRTLYN